MTEIRPLEPADAAHLELDATWAGASGNDTHRAGLWIGRDLVGAVRLTGFKRVRRGHAANVNLHATEPDHAERLLEAVRDFADAWTTFDRLQLTMRADPRVTPVATSLGFALEVRRATRHVDGTDELTFGRLRPGFVPRPVGPPPPWPTRHRRKPTSVVFRPLIADDSTSMRDLSIERTGVWGTLQTPWSNERFYAERHENTPVDHVVLGVVADGELAGSGGLHTTGIDGVLALGMSIAAAWQGCGLGGALMDQLISIAKVRGARRLELGVWEDNARARALYTSRRFEGEGTLRFDSVRDGGHASSHEMNTRP